MTPERWKQVEEIYQAALDRDLAARPAFLAEACAGDEALRHEVESLLDAHRSEGRFLESGAMKMAARDLAAGMPRATAGQRLGAYQLVELLGAGGMGEVWRALDPGLRRHVAIKILPSQFSADPDRLRRFEQEAQAAGRLNHPNVLSVYAIGEHEGFPYLVTELLEGMTLRQALAGGPLPEARALEYADQLVQGLAAAHDKGIVHRDLKPDNVFVTSDERIKILDFGLAKLAPAAPEHETQTRTATGMALGTPGYMAPEQVRGDGGRSSDRRVCCWRGAVRNARRPAPLCRGDGRGDDDGDSQGGSAADAWASPHRSSRWCGTVWRRLQGRGISRRATLPSSCGCCGTHHRLR